jgi:hypothetical protein
MVHKTQLQSFWTLAIIQGGLVLRLPWIMPKVQKLAGLSFMHPPSSELREVLLTTKPPQQPPTAWQKHNLSVLLTEMSAELPWWTRG